MPPIAYLIAPPTSLRLGLAAAILILVSGCSDNAMIDVQSTVADRGDNPGGETPEDPGGDTPEDRSRAFAGYRSEVYGDLEQWLCHPARAAEADVCRRNLETVAVDADGSRSLRNVAKSRPTPASVDCFYVYPTASFDIAANADRRSGAQERDVTELQFAHYRDVCRTYAPLYRQSTLSFLALSVITQGLGNGLSVLLEPLAALIDPLAALDQQLVDALALNAARERAGGVAYADVLDAFKHYVENESDGRGFLLIGHSQGATLLARLIREEIETRPLLQRRLIAAHLPGGNIAVPRGSDVGATFQSTPACRHSDETGCVVAFSTYRQGDPDLEGEPVYGVTDDPGTIALCTHPGALVQGSADMNAVIPFDYPPVFDLLIIPRGSGGPYADRARNREIEAPYYAVPGQISGQCQHNTNDVSYLEARIAANPRDPRADDYPGEFLGGDGWGLHLIDMTIVMDDLVQLAAKQAHAWQVKRRPSEALLESDPFNGSEQ